MNEVFADTFYFLALDNPHDEAHERALAHSRDLRCRLVTTAWVLLEVGNTMRAPLDRKRFLELLDLFEEHPNAVILPPALKQFDAGVELYGRRLDKGWSVTDCISFVVMRERRISEALTGDRHFVQAGFKALLV